MYEKRQSFDPLRLKQLEQKIESERRLALVKRALLRLSFCFVYGNRENQLALFRVVTLIQDIATPLQLQAGSNLDERAGHHVMSHNIDELAQTLLSGLLNKNTELCEKVPEGLVKLVATVVNMSSPCPSNAQSLGLLITLAKTNKFRGLVLRMLCGEAYPRLRKAAADSAAACAALGSTSIVGPRRLVQLLYHCLNSGSAEDASFLELKLGINFASVGTAFAAIMNKKGAAESTWGELSGGTEDIINLLVLEFDLQMKSPADLLSSDVWTNLQLVSCGLPVLTKRMETSYDVASLENLISFLENAFSRIVRQGLMADVSRDTEKKETVIKLTSAILEIRSTLLNDASSSAITVAQEGTQSKRRSLKVAPMPLVDVAAVPRRSPLSSLAEASVHRLLSYLQEGRISEAVAMPRRPVEVESEHLDPFRDFVRRVSTNTAINEGVRLQRYRMLEILENGEGGTNWRSITQRLVSYTSARFFKQDASCRLVLDIWKVHLAKARASVASSPE